MAKKPQNALVLYARERGIYVHFPKNNVSFLQKPLQLQKVDPQSLSIGFKKLHTCAIQVPLWILWIFKYQFLHSCAT